MKTIFISIFDGAISKNIFRTSVFSLLKEDYRVVVFVPASKLDYYETRFGGPDVFFEPTPRADHPFFETRFHSLALSSLHTRTVKIKILHDYVAKGKLLKAIGRFALWQTGRLRFFHRAMRLLYSWMPDASFDRYFDKYNPCGVFVPNMLSNEDFRLVKAARRRNVTSIGMPKSWDNFTGKTFFNIFPDWVLVQNAVMYRQAQELFGFPPERMSIVGFPSFDIYFKPHIVSRADFCKRLGLDPEKKIILYAAAGHQLAPRDEHVLNYLITQIGHRKELIGKTQVLIRPHPKYEFHEEMVAKTDFVKIDRPGNPVTDKISSWEFENKDVEHLVQSLAHMDVLVSTMSTLNLEGAIFGKPLISIGFEVDKKYPYADSTARYYDYEQTENFVSSGAVYIARNPEEFMDQVVQSLEQPGLKSCERGKFLDQMVGAIDGGSGQRVASFIRNTLGT